MRRRHYTKADFVVTERGNGIQVGYCRKCTADMQILSDGILRHYRSHITYKQQTVIRRIQ